MDKSLLDFYVHKLDQPWQTSNPADEIKALVSKRSRYKLTRVVMEVTGGYERHLVEALVERELPVVIVQPMQVRQFAKAQGIMAKIDKIDARLIAQFSAVIRP